ncbi:MAG: YceI family protein [Caldilineaceae bacterium SB0668_bin_21]|nr:YceI family protein [Caldilineaceae bacterium SB0668_bin_21]MYC21029.1 YceI family protein [Caldilineaceae bacterium SB0662_bin_25]
MKSGTRLFLIILIVTLSASCRGRANEQPSDQAQAAESLPATEDASQSVISERAAAAFAGLDPIRLQQGEGWRVFRIDAGSSKAAYIVDEELFADATRKYGLDVGKTKVVGETQDLVGLMQLDLDQRSIGGNRFVVYLPTLQTDQDLRDGWIRENALESDRFPLAIFVAERLLEVPHSYTEGEEVSFQLEGELELRGTTLSTVWDVSANQSGSTIQGSMQTRLRMTDLGFDPPDFANTLTVQDEFTVRIEFVANEE